MAYWSKFDREQAFVPYITNRQQQRLQFQGEIIAEYFCRITAFGFCATIIAYVNGRYTRLQFT